MADANLAQTSDTMFWAALITYAVSMVLFFASLAYRARRTGSVATTVAWLGLLVHAASIALRGLATARMPWGNMFEYSTMLGLILVAAYLFVIDRRLGLRQVGGFAMAAGVLSLGTARLVYAPAGPLVPALDSYWLRFHVIAAIVGSALFGLSFIFTVLALARARAERRAGTVFAGSTVGAAFVGSRERAAAGPIEDLAAEDPHGQPVQQLQGMLGHLPAAARLDLLAYRTIQFAFPIWTFAVIAGAIWAHEAWGRYWGWDPKETWAFITWVIYAGYLHARATAGWRGSRAAIVNIIGFGAVLFTYFAVNLWISGLHSYAGT